MLANKSDYFEVNKQIKEKISEILVQDSEVLDELYKSNDLDTVLAVANDAISQFHKTEAFGDGMAAGHGVWNGNILQVLKGNLKLFQEGRPLQYL